MRLTDALTKKTVVPEDHFSSDDEEEDTEKNKDRRITRESFCVTEIVSQKTKIHRKNVG